MCPGYLSEAVYGSAHSFGLLTRCLQNRRKPERKDMSYEKDLEEFNSWWKKEYTHLALGFRKEDDVRLGWMESRKAAPVQQTTTGSTAIVDDLIDKHKYRCRNNGVRA